jgi:hypothetical protein
VVFIGLNDDAKISHSSNAVKNVVSHDHVRFIAKLEIRRRKSDAAMHRILSVIALLIDHSSFADVAFGF